MVLGESICISGYFSAFLAGIGLNLPDWAASNADEGSGSIINIPAIAACLPVTWILSCGAKAFGRFELVAVAIKVVLILFNIGLDGRLRPSSPRLTSTEHPSASHGSLASPPRCSQGSSRSRPSQS